MALAGFRDSSTDMFTHQHHGDYVSPDFYALLMEGSGGCEQPQSTDALLNYNNSTTTTTLADLLPAYSDLSSSSSAAGLDYHPLSVTNSPCSESRHHQHSILSFDNIDNLHYPPTYSAPSSSSSSSSSSSMLCFYHLENSASVLAAGGSLYPNNVVTYHDSPEASADHHVYGVAEKQPRWLYPMSNAIFNYESSDELLAAAAHKRPYMGILMDDGQTNKRHCDGMVLKNPKPVVCRDPSLAAKNRRERISGKLRILQELVPSGTKVDLVTMLDKAFHYVKFLQLQVKVLATDEFWPGNGVNAPEVGEVREAIDAILASQRQVNHSSATGQCFQTERSKP